MVPGQYDVIVADLFHPARDGAGTLYSLEHFRALRQRLAPGGLLCQWLPLYQLDEPILQVIIRTFLEVFPETRAFLLRFNVETPVLGLIGAARPQRYPADYFAARVTDRALAARLSSDQLRDGIHLLGCFLADSQTLRAYAATAPLNTDDQPVVVFGAPRFNVDGSAKPHGRLLDLLDRCASDPRDLVQTDTPSGIEFAEALARFVAARTAYLRGLAAEAEGNQDRAVDAFVESARLSPLFATGYAQCLSLAMRKSQTDPAAARQLLQRLVQARPERPVAGELLRRLESIPPNP